MPVSDDAVLRHLKRLVSLPVTGAPPVIEIDDVGWGKGQTYGTIIVDPERRTVVDVLGDQSSQSVATWLGAYPSVKIISRNRHGLYAEGACVGAPQA